MDCQTQPAHWPNRPHSLFDGDKNTHILKKFKQINDPAQLTRQVFKPQLAHKLTTALFNLTKLALMAQWARRACRHQMEYSTARTKKAAFKQTIYDGLEKKQKLITRTCLTNSHTAQLIRQLVNSHKAHKFTHINGPAQLIRQLVKRAASTITEHAIHLSNQKHYSHLSHEFHTDQWPCTAHSTDCQTHGQHPNRQHRADSIKKIKKTITLTCLTNSHRSMTLHSSFDSLSNTASTPGLPLCCNASR